MVERFLHHDILNYFEHFDSFGSTRAYRRSCITTSRTRASCIFVTKNCTLNLGSCCSVSYAQRAQSTIPATLIGNWEIAGIRSGDVSQSEDITVIGHLKLPERKVTFVLVWRTHLAKCSTWRCGVVATRSRENRAKSTVPNNFQYYRIHLIIYFKCIISLILWM